MLLYRISLQSLFKTERLVISNSLQCLRGITSLSFFTLVSLVYISNDSFCCIITELFVYPRFCLLLILLNFKLSNYYLILPFSSYVSSDSPESLLLVERTRTTGFRCWKLFSLALSFFSYGDMSSVWQESREVILASFGSASKLFFSGVNDTWGLHNF